MSSQYPNSPWSTPSPRSISRTGSASTANAISSGHAVNPSPLRYVVDPVSSPSQRVRGWNIDANVQGSAFPSPNSAFSNMAQAAPASDDLASSHDELLSRYHAPQTLQGENAFVMRLLQRISELEDQLREQPLVTSELEDAAERIMDQNLALADRYKTSEERLERAERLLALDPFVLVLIDGDHLLFEKKLMTEGESGGAKAAAELKRQFQKYISKELPLRPDAPRISARIYSDMADLARYYNNVTPLGHQSRFADFARGFTKAESCFDWIDVGRSGADAKIKDLLFQHLQDPHCRQIFLGCTQDDEQTLQTLSADAAEANDLITLTTHQAAIDPLEKLGFRTINPGNIWHPRQSTLSKFPTILTGNDTLPASRTGSTIAVGQMSLASILKENKPDKPIRPVVRASQNPIPLVWSKKAKPVKSVAPKPKQEHHAFDASAGGIARNRQGLRIDPVVKHDKDEVERVKKMGMCNVYYLRHDCPYGSTCSRKHDVRPTSKDLDYLSLLGRMVPCGNGSGCEDVKCIYGHICPAPPGRHGELCIFADRCRFPKKMHTVDRIAVKLIKP